MTVNGVQRGVGKLGWITLAILSFAYAIAMIDRIILTLLVEPIKRDLQINDTQFGFLQGFAFAAFYAVAGLPLARIADNRSEEHTSELQSLMRISYAVFCLKKKHAREKNIARDT